MSFSAFVKVFTDQYSESTGIAGIHYLAIALGSTGEKLYSSPETLPLNIYLVGGQVGARALNSVYRRLKAKNGGIGTPEMRS